MVTHGHLPNTIKYVSLGLPPHEPEYLSENGTEYLSRTNNWAEIMNSKHKELGIDQLMDIKTGVELVKEFVKSIILLPAIGLPDTVEIIRKKFEPLRNTVSGVSNTILQNLERSLESSIRGHPPNSTMAFDYLIQHLLKFRRWSNFKCIIVTSTRFNALAIEKKLSRLSQLQWLTIRHVLSPGKGNSEERMTKQNYAKNIEAFTIAERSVLILTAPFRKVGDERVKLDSLIFYCVQDSKKECKLPIDFSKVYKITYNGV